MRNVAAGEQERHARYLVVALHRHRRFQQISLKKSVSNFEIIGPAIRRCSIANR